MTVLIKNFIAADPGSPGTPPTPASNEPGIPPTAPTPAYCVDVSKQVEGYRTVIIPYPADPATFRPAGVLIVQVSTGPTWVVETTCYPASPGSPGVPGAPIPGVPGIPPVPPTPADYLAGWNASARSIDSLTGNGQYKFSVPTDSVGVVTGLNDQNNGSAYQEIDFAFSMASGKYDIMEGGSNVGVSGTFVSSDVFAIARIGTTILYYKNGTLLYTSKTQSVGIVFVDSSLYFGNDKIVDASLSSTVDTGFSNTPAQLSGVMDSMVSFFADNDGAYLQGTALPSMTGDFRENVSRVGQLTGVLPTMTGKFVDPYASALEGVMDGMTGYFESGLMQPQFMAMDLTLQAMSGFMYALTGVNTAFDVKLPSMTGYFSDSANPFMPSGTPPSTTDPVDPVTGDWQGRGGTQLPMMTGLFLDEATLRSGIGTTAGGDITLPSPLEVAASIGQSIGATGGAILPSPLVVKAEFGWKLDIELPMISVDAHGVFENVLRLDATLPMLTVHGEGIVGTVVSTLDNPLPLPSLEAYGKISKEGEGSLVLPSLKADGHILANLIAAGDIRLPRLKVAGHIITPLTIDPANPSGRTLQGHVVLPAIQGARTSYGAVLLPRMLVSGRSVQAPAGTAVEARVGYAMNIKTNAVTEFTNYPFRAMGRAYNMYWGIGLDGGLYEMGGDLDDTKPIGWEWRSGLADFGVWGQKGVLAVYIRAIFENGAVIKFVTDDAIREYSHVAAGPYNTHKVHRVPLGRGVRTDSMAFGMANPKGGYLELDKVTPQYVIIPRNL